jgi:outer membrane protein OmpA-like peptidoglycan-associated protein
VDEEFWIVGKDPKYRGWWIALTAIAGLIGLYAYGLTILLPQVDAGTLARIVSPAAEPAIAVFEGSPAPVEVEETAPKLASESEPLPPPEPQAVVDERASDAQTPATASEVLPDPCIAAMDAALSGARIEFLSSSIEIVPASRNVISVLAALAHTCPGRILIAGHSDNRGAEVANQQISLARAESVAETFIEFGLDPDRLTVQGLGSAQPIADNSTVAGRARNRRIEISLLTDESPAPGD